MPAKCVRALGACLAAGTPERPCEHHQWHCTAVQCLGRRDISKHFDASWNWHTWTDIFHAYRFGDVRVDSTVMTGLGQGIQRLPRGTRYQYWLTARLLLL
jgi:hypothetical protein